jgi:C4-dicarboxylate-binding protein DctP
MKPLRTTLRLGLVAALLALTGCGQEHQEARTLKLSLEVPASHIRYSLSERFAEEVAALSKGTLAVEIYPSAQLYDNSGAPKALAIGSLDLYVANLNLLARFEPNADLLGLPMFAGASREDVRRVLDGALGTELYAGIERRLRVKVLGAHIEAGAETLFTTGRAVRSFDDIAGLKLGMGGTLAIARYRSLGAYPITMGRADLPLALTQGQVDGLVGYDDTVRAGKLWDTGISYAFETHDGWAAYLALVSQKTWNSLNADQQAALVQGWAAMVEWGRALAAEKQDQAKAINQQNGIVYYTPTAEDIARERTQMHALQSDLVRQRRMDQRLMEQIRHFLLASSTSVAQYDEPTP